MVSLNGSSSDSYSNYTQVTPYDRCVAESERKIVNSAGGERDDSDDESSTTTKDAVADYSKSAFGSMKAGEADKKLAMASSLSFESCLNILQAASYAIEEDNSIEHRNSLIKSAVKILTSAGQSSCTLSLSCEAFIKTMEHSDWKDLLNPKQLEMLFTLAVGLDQKPMNLLTFLQTILWLGDPKIVTEESPPAAMAIEFYFYLIFKQSSILGNYHYFKSRHSLKITIGNPIFRLNEGRCQKNVNGSYTYFYRGLVFSSNNVDMPHRIMFQFDPKTNKLVPASEQSTVKYRRRNEPKSEESLLSVANSLLRSWNGGNRNPL